jgi:hypothetical protein
MPVRQDNSVRLVRREIRISRQLLSDSWQRAARDKLAKRHLLDTLYMDERKWSDSENMLRHATELNDHFAPSYFALGALLNEQRKPNEAIKTIERA